MIAAALTEGGATGVAAYIAVILSFLLVFTIVAAVYYRNRFEEAVETAEEALHRVNVASDTVVDAHAALLQAQGRIHELERRLNRENTNNGDQL